MQLSPRATAPDLITRYHAAPVPGIAPVDGWQLCVFDDFDTENFLRAEYIARRPGLSDVKLDVSAFDDFTPSDERFAFLVRNGFPHRARKREWGVSVVGPWNDTELEQAMRRPVLRVVR